MRIAAPTVEIRVRGVGVLLRVEGGLDQFVAVTLVHVIRSAMSGGGAIGLSPIVMAASKSGVMRATSSGLAKTRTSGWPAVDRVAQADEHFEADRKVEHVAEFLAAAAEIDDDEPSRSVSIAVT